MRGRMESCGRLVIVLCCWVHSLLLKSRCGAASPGGEPACFGKCSMAISPLKSGLADMDRPPHIALNGLSFGLQRGSLASRGLLRGLAAQQPACGANQMGNLVGALLDYRIGSRVFLIQTEGIHKI
jgi:hypothetical protein